MSLKRNESQASVVKNANSLKRKNSDVSRVQKRAEGTHIRNLPTIANLKVEMGE